MGKINGQRYHILYRTTNMITNKFYIGIHSTYNLSDGYLGSGKRIKRAVEKYGEENFRCEILEFFETREELLKKEKEIVNEQLLNDPLCMNLQPGGGGGLINESHKQKWLEAGSRARNEKLKELWENPEWVEKQSKIRKKNWENPEFRKKCLKNWLFKGKKHSEETKIKMRKSKNVGENNSQFGTCWIKNETETKKIKKEELTFYLEKGWIKGRIM